MKKAIARQRYMIDFTLSSLWRRKGKNLCLVTVFTLIVFVIASVMFFTSALRSEAAATLKNAPDIIVQRNIAGRYEQIPVSYMERIKEIRGVMAVKERLWGYYYDPLVLANYTLMVPDAVPQEPGTIAIGSGIARIRKADTGDILSFVDCQGDIQNLDIKAVMPRESELLTADLIMISETDFRRMFGVRKELATDLALTVRNSKELTTVAAKIKKILPDTRPIIRDEILRTYDAVFNWRGGLMVVILGAAVLAFVILAWDKATGLSSEEKKEIGVLKAVGWETSDILLVKFWEGIAISLTSFLTGIILAYGHVFFTSSVLFVPVLKGWSTLYPEFRLVPMINVGQIMTLFFLTVLPYTVVTIVPSWRAATIDPDTVMR